MRLSAYYARVKTLGDALGSRDNAMNFLRLLLATAVIVSHSLPITGSDDPTGHGIHELGTWAVHGFFIASGYLIAMSRMRTGLAPFMWRRFIRIFPAFWVSLALVAFVIAPVTALLAGEQIVWRSALGYVFRNAGLWVFQSEVADTLTDLPLPHVWQGTLWTLAFEFVAYLSAGALLSLRLVRRYPVQIIGALLACSVALMVVVAEPQPMAVNPAVNGVRLAGYFLAGMLFYFLRDKVRFSWAWMVVGFAMIAAAAIHWLEQRIHVGSPTTCVPCPRHRVSFTRQNRIIQRHLLRNLHLRLARAAGRCGHHGRGRGLDYEHCHSSRRCGDSGCSIMVCNRAASTEVEGLGRFPAGGGEAGCCPRHTALRLIRSRGQ